MRRLGLTALISGIGFFEGCGVPGDKIIYETEMKGPLKVNVIRKVINANPDRYRLEVRDSDDNVRISIRYIPHGVKITNDDGKAYKCENGVDFYEQDKDFKKPKETD